MEYDEPPFTEKTLSDKCPYCGQKPCKEAYLGCEITKAVEAERNRVLALIESKKALVHEVDSEWFGWELLDLPKCCPGDDAAFAYEFALTSLAEELKQ